VKKLHFTINPANPMPLYFQIAESLEQAIEHGALEPGRRLDNENDLARQFGVSRPTIRKAIAVLANQGLVVRRRGSGTVVVPHPVKRRSGYSSLYDDLKNAGRQPTTQVLSIRELPAPSNVAQMLGMPEGQTVSSIERLRFADGLPLALMHNYLPLGNGAISISAQDLESRGLYELLRLRGQHPHVTNQSISARSATSAEVRLLQVSAKSTLLTVSAISFDFAGRPLEFGDHAYLAARYTLETTIIGSQTIA
jgi:DNA-binding GntR family transcriptional regulator